MSGIQVAIGHHSEHGMVVILRLQEGGVVMTLPFQLPEAQQLRETLGKAIESIEDMMEV